MSIEFFSFNGLAILDVIPTYVQCAHGDISLGQEFRNICSESECCIKFLLCKFDARTMSTKGPEINFSCPQLNVNPS